MYKLLYILFISFFFFTSIVSAKPVNNRELVKSIEQYKKDTNNLESIRQLSMNYLYKFDYKSSIHYGQKLYELSNIGGKMDTLYCLYSHIILGQANIMMQDSVGVINHLNIAEEIANKIHNDSALCSVYNGMGLYYVNFEKDTYTALSYFFKGLSLSNECNYTRLYSILLANIVIVYYEKSDTSGLPYALECYNLGHEYNDPYLIHISCYSVSLMYYLKGDYTNALNFIKEDETVVELNNYEDNIFLYSSYAMILAGLRNYDEAIEKYEKALSYKNTNNQAESLVHAYVYYAHTLMDIGRYEESLNMLREGEKVANENDILLFRDRLYQTYTELYEKTGNLEKALAYQKLVNIEQDSLYNIGKEKAVDEFRIKYYTEKLENEIQQTRIEQIKRSRRLQLMIAIAFILCAISLAIVLMYRKTRKLYKSIIIQNNDSIHREKNMEIRISELQHLLDIQSDKKPKNDDNTIKYSGSSLSDERFSNLFNKLEMLMKEQRIYTDNMITKEKVAEMLDTNRTYLSQIINDKTGKTFTQYINSYRIREAVVILSQKNDNTPLKAIATELGFNSMTTFYSLFQVTVGMTPSQYRSSVKSI